MNCPNILQDSKYFSEQENEEAKVVDYFLLGKASVTALGTGPPGPGLNNQFLPSGIRTCHDGNLHLNKIRAITLKYFPYKKVLSIITNISKTEIWLNFPLAYQTSFILFQLLLNHQSLRLLTLLPFQSLLSSHPFPKIRDDPLHTVFFPIRFRYNLFSLRHVYET